MEIYNTYIRSFDGLLWLLIGLFALQFVQRSLHKEIQAVLLIISRSQNFTIAVFSLLFFPGVFLHELSHFVMAKLLGVRTGKFSLFPKMMDDGRLQLGYVEAAKTDIFRDSLVGLAPLISGMLFVAISASNFLHLTILWDTLRNQQWSLFFLGIQALPTVPNFWIWFTATFAVSTTMLPSESDRHAWLPLGMLSLLLLVIAVFSGAGPWMMQNLAPTFNIFLRSSSLLLLVSVLIHFVLIIPNYLLHRLISKVIGVDVE